MRRRDLIAALVGAAVVMVLAGSVAWAAIPGPSGVIQGCYDGGGNVKVVEALPCPRNYTPFQWNQQGPQGSQGPQGLPGGNGTDGVSPTVAALAAGDPNCPAGGAAITDAAGGTAYVCSGQTGADGQPFAGTFTSPNGEYSISVTNDGITLSRGSDTAIMLTGSNVTVLSGSLFRVTAGSNVTVNAAGAVAMQSGTSTTMKSGSAFAVDSATNLSARAGSSITVQSGSSTAVQAASGLSLTGAEVRLNDGPSCAAAARTGDSVVAGSITTGSTTVCVG